MGTWNRDIGAEACRRNSSGRKGGGHRTIQAEPKANAEKSEMFGLCGEWGEVKCGCSIWHVGEWQEMLLAEQLGQDVKGHQCSAKGFGIYPAGNRDPAEVFSRTVK